MGSCNWRAPKLSQYFTEKDFDRILRNLDGLRSMVFPLGGTDMQDDANAEQPFPSVCLIGLGRCGSNIALDVASLVYNARQFYSNEFGTRRSQQESGRRNRAAAEKLDPPQSGPHPVPGQQAGLPDRTDGDAG